MKQKTFTIIEINNLLKKVGVNITFEEMLEKSEYYCWWKCLSYNWKIFILYNYNYQYREFGLKIVDYDLIINDINNYDTNKFNEFIYKIKGIEQFFTQFENNTIYDLKELYFLENVERFFGQNLRIKDILTVINLKNIKFIDLSNSCIDSCMYLSKAHTLEHLKIAETNISSLKGLETLQNLIKLNANSTKIKSLNPIKKLENLEYLSIIRTKINNLEPLSNLTKLKTLHCFSTNIKDLNPLNKLQQIESININNTEVSDLLPLKNNNNLIQIRAKGTNVSEENAKELKVYLPNVEIYLD